MENFSQNELKEISLFFRAINKTVNDQPITPLHMRHKTSTLTLDLTIVKHTSNN